MNNRVKVLVVDDHPLVAQATKQLLEQIDRIEVIGIEGTGQACLAFIENCQPDMILLDYHLPDQPGTAVTAKIKSKYPHIDVVIFTGKDIADLINPFLEQKVSGIISKESGETTILNAIRCMLDGHATVPVALFHQMRMMNRTSVFESILTDEEMQMMSMIVRGETHEQIARQVHASKRSVDNYLRKIYEKLGVQNKVQAIEKYVQNKL